MAQEKSFSLPRPMREAKSKAENIFSFALRKMQVRVKILQQLRKSFYFNEFS
jgi:hypothetical protein